MFEMVKSSVLSYCLWQEKILKQFLYLVCLLQWDSNSWNLSKCRYNTIKCFINSTEHCGPITPCWLLQVIRYLLITNENCESFLVLIWELLLLSSLYYMVWCEPFSTLQEFLMNQNCSIAWGCNSCGWSAWIHHVHSLITVNISIYNPVVFFSPL